MRFPRRRRENLPSDRKNRVKKVLDSPGKLSQFETYAAKVFSLPKLLSNFFDSRRSPDIQTFDVVNSLFHTALLRIPSINALEGDLKEADFQKLVGFEPKQDDKLFSADVISNVLDKLDLRSGSDAAINVIKKAERNKVFREGWHGALRYVAVDGWEPFCSYHRHCPHCLTRMVEKKLPSGEKEKVVQYYHRFVVAMIIDETMDLALDFEPIRPADLREDDLKDKRHEGELTAAKRLLPRIKRTYPWIDVMVGDSLYTNGPFLTLLKELKMGAVLIAKKSRDEPLKDALAIFGDTSPEKVINDSESGELIELWDVKDIETLDTYKGKIRVVRGLVTKPKAKGPTTWCMAVIGKANVLSPRQVLAVARGRWHIENTGFHQWVSHWNLKHVFRHTDNALRAILLIWTLAFNLLQLFIYRRLKRARRPIDPTDTIRHIVEVMNRNVGALTKPIAWLEIIAFI
ncbi:MAG: transposase [Proteobacteria bacterium]|nr:transposase [Pseudomonadota bacterium]